ncbi:MAG TPA: NUDIX hydrolase [Nitrospirota bacterium]|nr:NUDIX hydrolase [Nitrospirota bacterium]
MEIVSKKIVWKGKFMSAVEITYRDAKGVLRTWEALERVGIGGIVVMVAVTPTGNVILEKQFRPPVGREVLELPAGLVEPGESMEVAAKRELIEETGWSAGRLEFLAEGPISTGASTEALRAYLCTELVFVGKNGGDDNEIIEVIEVPLGHAQEYLHDAQSKDTLIDLKVFGLVELARKALGL